MGKNFFSKVSSLNALFAILFSYLHIKSYRVHLFLNCLISHLILLHLFDYTPINVLRVTFHINHFLPKVYKFGFLGTAALFKKRVTCVPLLIAKISSTHSDSSIISINSRFMVLKHTACSCCTVVLFCRENVAISSFWFHAFVNVDLSVCIYLSLIFSIAPIP